MNMRKIIAVLAAVLLLCAIIPMGAISVSAAGILDTNFDDGTVQSWSCDETIVVEDGALKWTTASWKNLYHNFTAVAGKNYVLTFKAKAAAAATVDFKFLSSSWGTSGIATYSPTLTTEWAEYSYEFNSLTYGGLVLLLQSHKATDIYLDDVKIALAPGEAIYSNDFENGTSGWGKSTNTVLTTDTGVTGSALKATHADDWAYVYTWMDVEADTDYTISFKAKADKGGFSINFKNNEGWASLNDTIGKISPSISTVWKEYSFDFNTGSFSGRLLIFFSSNQYGSAAQSIWLDDVVVSLKKTSIAPEGAIYFEDFEDDHTWASASTATAEVVDASAAPVAGVNSQNKVYMHTVPSGAYPYVSETKSIAVTPNTAYVLQFDALNTSANWPVQGIIAENYWLGGAFFTTSSQNIKPRTDAWETYSVVFNSGDHSSIYVGLKSQWANTTVYFDNVAIIPLDKAVKNDGYVKNGDFETGDALEWLHADSTKVVKDLNGDHGYVMETAELVSGGHLFSQPVSNLVVGAEYVLSFKVNCYSASTGNSAFWVQFPSAFTTWTVDTTLGKAQANNYTPRINVTTNVNAWYDVNITFTAQAETALIRFLNYRGNQGYYFFDDIAITHEHKWADATCTDPKTCACGATEGEALGHSWTDATCTAPKTCSVCSETEGEALGHTYDYDCDADCNVCGATREAAHSYYYPCDPVCQICYEITNPDAAHSVKHVKAVEPTCTENGNVEYWYCEYCGSAWLDEAQTQLTNQRNVIIPAAHTYDDDCDGDCNVCEEWRDAPHNLTTHVEAVVPANCQEEGYNEHWICEDCGGYFMDNGAGGYYETNPAWMYYTGEHVRPEGAAGCAVVACELCGEDSYGTEACVRPEGDPVCQNSTCVNCGGEIYGEGCTYGYDEDWNPLSPFCQPGDCIYCGTHYEYLYEHENGSYAPCSVDGECVYGCGKQYPATGEHAVDNPCEGGLCWMCWEEIPAADHEYDNAFDADCNVCGEVRAVVNPITFGGNSRSEDVSGLAFKFDVAVDGMAVNGTEAIYDGATIDGYKLISMGAIVSNAKSELDIPAVYLCDLEADSASFAVRVINIPEANYGDEITAVPYFVVEIDGVETTIYGEAQTATYNG